MAERDHSSDKNPRTDRLRSALRENLRRRKEQARARNQQEGVADPGGRPNSARISDDDGR